MIIQPMLNKHRRSVALAGTLLFLMGGHPASAAGPCPVRQETFYSRLPTDLIAQISGGPGAPAFPPGAGTLSEPGVAKAGILFHKLRNAASEAIGVASQMQRALLSALGTPVQDTAWTVVIPARGTLFLQQIEDVTAVRRAVGRRKAEPTLPAVEIQTSVGPRADGRGLIVGGSGEFEGCTGSFVEVEIVQGADPANPVALGLVGGVELRISFGD